MKGSIVTKLMAMVILCIIAFGSFMLFKQFLEPMWAVLAGIAAPLILIVLLGTLFGDDSTKAKPQK